VGGHDDQIGLFFFGGLDYFLSRRADFYKDTEMIFLILFFAFSAPLR